MALQLLNNSSAAANEGLERLIAFARDYFSRVTSVLMDNRATADYKMPSVIAGERRTREDDEREHMLLQKVHAADVEFSDSFQKIANGTANADEKAILAFYNEVRGRHITPAELGELRVIGRKLDEQTVAYYDGEVIVLGSKSALKTVAHELNHALRHQATGVLERHTGYSSIDEFIISAVGDGQERIPPEIVEFVADLAPFIMESFGMEHSWKPMATINGFQEAAKYFEGGYAAKATELIEDALAVVNAAKNYSLDATEESFNGLVSLVRKGVDQLGEKATKFVTYSPYLVLLDESASRETMDYVVSQVENVLKLPATLRSMVQEDGSLQEKHSALTDFVEFRADSLESGRRNVDTFLSLDNNFSDNKSGPYKIVSMALDFNRERLKEEWPQIFSMSASQIEERYFKPLEERFVGALKRYEESKPASAAESS